MDALRASLTPGRLSAAVGPACANLTRAHLRDLGQNKRGWPTTNFWARAAKATSWRRVPEGTVVSINQIGVRQRFFGGPISPVNAKALTIPISPVAYGHVASDFPGIFALKTPKGTYLVQKDETEGMKKRERAKAIRGMGGNWKRREAGTLHFLFKLVSSVLQGPNPGVLPDMDEYRAESNKAVLAAVIKRDR